MVLPSAFADSPCNGGRPPGSSFLNEGSNHTAVQPIWKRRRAVEAIRSITVNGMLFAVLN
jgi:hypothetical protein